jgi:Dolichyl-phosphate-mannose-protein mannosyltransferase
MNYKEIIKENYQLILILIVATIFRFYHLDFQSPWLDEIYTLKVSNPNNSFSVLLEEVKTNGGFPYLYFITMKLLLGILGYTSFVARMFSAVFGVLAIYAIYLFGKEIFNKKMGLYAALIFTFSEYSIYISQEARPYTFYLFGIIMSFYGLVKFIKLPTLKNAIIYGFLSGLLLNTNFFGFVNMFSQVIILLFYVIIYPKNERIKFIKHSSISGTIALFLFIPNITLFSNLFGFKSNWIPAPTNESFTLLFKEFLGNSEMTLLIFSSIFVLYLIFLFKEKETFNFNEIIANKIIFSFTIILPWIFLFISVLVIKSYTDTSVIVSRYFTSILPIFFIIIGIGFYLIQNKVIRYSVLFCLVTLMWINKDIVRKYYEIPFRTQFRETANFVINNNNKNEQVITSLKYWYEYYFNLKSHDYSIIEKPNLEAVINEMIQDPSKVKPFWYLDAHGRPYTLSESAQKFVNEKFYVENNFDGIDAWCKHYILLKDVPTTIDISKFKDIKEKNGDIFLFSIENYENTNNIVKTSGWAYFDKQSSEKTNIGLVFIKDGKAERLTTQKVNRPDVTSYFKCDFNADNSGFSSTFDISKLTTGKYQLAIYVINKEIKKEGLILTDKFLEKQ